MADVPMLQEIHEYPKLERRMRQQGVQPDIDVAKRVSELRPLANTPATAGQLAELYDLINTVYECLCEKIEDRSP